MNPWARTVLASLAIVVVVAVTGLMLTGLPAPAKILPTGLGGREGSGRSVLNFRAPASVQEYSTSVRPMIRRRTGGVEVAYAGCAKDIGLHRKIRVFQAVYHGVAAGQRWVFAIRLRGLVMKAYSIVGMEWFNSQGKLVGEKDVYPPPSRTYQRAQVAVTLPGGATYIAVYVQLLGINPQTRLDVTAASP